MTEKPERFKWAVKVINAKSDDHILEIGCGAGLLLEELGKNISKGHLKGVDKSKYMIDLAKKRNEALLEKRLISLENVDFIKAQYEKESYDKIISFNVNLFLKNSEKELDLIRNILKPKGQLYIFYQAPFEIDIEFGLPITKNLEEHSFSIIKNEIKKMKPTPSICIIAKKNKFKERGF